MAKREVIGTVLSVDETPAKPGWGWTPSGVEVAPDHLVIGDRACQIREVAAWPSAIAPGSVSDVALVAESALVIALAAVPAEQVRASINRALPRQQSAAREAQRKGTVDAESERRIQDALGLLDAIASGSVRHFDVRVSGIYWGDAAEGVRASGAVAQRRGRERGMDLVSLRHSQAQSYHGALPGGQPVLRGLLLDQTQASALWPYTDEDLLDRGGIYVGLNERTGSPVLYDGWTPDVRHKQVTGENGAGKGFVTKLMASQERIMGRPVLVLDPSATREYRVLVEALGGTYIDLQPAGTDHINPIAIAPDGKAIADGKTPEQTTGRPMAGRIAAVKPVIAALCGESLETGPFDSLLDAALQATYKAAGFADAWAACFEAGKDALGALVWKPRHQWPVLSDVRRVLEGQPGGAAYAQMLAPYCAGGSADLLDGQTTIKPNSATVALGVNEIIATGGRFTRGGYAAVVDFAREHFQAMREPRKLLIADECHNFLADPQMSRWLERQLREARKAGTAVVVISQSVADFTRSAAGEAIFANTPDKFFFRQPAKDLRDAANALGLDEAVIGPAASLPRGHAIFLADNRAVALAVDAPAGLHRLFRADVAAAQAQGKER